MASTWAMRITMTTLAVVSSVIVGVTLLVSGGSKVAAGQRWPQEARGLGAPRFVIPVLPWIEIVVGAVLVTQIARRPVAAVALSMVGAFSILIARRLAAGEHPPCACFGAWSSKPIGPAHLIRNLGLMVLCVLAML